MQVHLSLNSRYLGFKPAPPLLRLLSDLMTHTELPVVSFICTALLVALLPVHFGRFSVTNLCITAWLLVCNVIHGVNAILWANTTELRFSIWCDIGEHRFSFPPGRATSSG